MKQKEYEKAEDSEEIEKLVTEVDTLEYLLFLVNRSYNDNDNNFSGA